MVELLELALIAVAGWLSGFVGSTIMWFVVGPMVIKRAAPGTIKAVVQKSFKVTDEELKASDDDLFQAVSKKQAKAMYGAIGNIVQAAPTEELNDLAKKYGFASASDAAAKLGPMVGSGAAPGLNPNLLATLAGANGGKKNAFSGVVELITALNALSSLGGAEGNSSGGLGFGGGGGGGFHPGLRGR